MIKEVSVKKDKKLDPKEAISNLQLQLRDHSEKAEYHKTMATKAQGALEVLLQLHPEKDNNES